MKEIVIWICLAYSVVTFIVFWIISRSQSNASSATRTLVERAAARVTATDDASGVLKEAAKLVEAFTKAGPAIASLGASIVALGFASYIVAQSPKDQDKTKTDTDKASQSTNPPVEKQ